MISTMCSKHVESYKKIYRKEFVRQVGHLPRMICTVPYVHLNTGLKKINPYPANVEYRMSS